jgi:hypothetical protein
MWFYRKHGGACTKIELIFQIIFCNLNWVWHISWYPLSFFFVKFSANLETDIYYHNQCSKLEDFSYKNFNYYRNLMWIMKKYTFRGLMVEFKNKNILREVLNVTGGLQSSKTVFGGFFWSLAATSKNHQIVRFLHLIQFSICGRESLHLHIYFPLEITAVHRSEI